MPLSKRRLIVNADDFGLSEGVNRGIIRAHERGIVTAASLMVRGRAAPDAALRARRAEGLSVGLHLDLGEWRYGPDGWQAEYERVDLDDAAAIAAEVDAQLDMFIRLM